MSISFGDVIHVCLDTLSVSVTLLSRWLGLSRKWAYSDGLECCLMCLLLVFAINLEFVAFGDDLW